MQTQTETETQPDTTALEQQIETGQARLAKLREAAEEAEAEAGRWRTTFEREPTAESHANKEIYAQRAKNASAAAEQHEREVLAPLLTKRELARQQAIRSELDGKASKILEDYESALDLIVAAADRLNEATRELAAQANPRHAARFKGVQNLHPLSLTSIAVTMNQKLAKFKGTAQELPLRHALFAFIDSDQNDARLRIELNLPANFVSKNLW